MHVPAAPNAPVYLLTLSCPDRIGIVADVSRFLVDHACNIAESAQCGDQANGRFFLRTAFTAAAPVALDRLRAEFDPIAQKFDMQVQFHDQRLRVRTLVMVSRFGHCLNDLLFRYQIGALPIDLRAIASNHPDFAGVAANSNVPFHHLPVSRDTRAEQERALLDIIQRESVELIVLARYMQVLSPEFCALFPGRIINIHHSFLPSFRGARPYHQAWLRGVKLIGATAHYVTDVLDEGPIIEQAVERVHHNLSADDYVGVGRDVESLVLARAVKWHAEHRILLNGRRTVVFQ